MLMYLSLFIFVVFIYFFFPQQQQEREKAYISKQERQQSKRAVKRYQHHPQNTLHPTFSHLPPFFILFYLFIYLFIYLLLFFFIFIFILPTSHRLSAYNKDGIKELHKPKPTTAELMAEPQVMRKKKKAKGL